MMMNYQMCKIAVWVLAGTMLGPADTFSLNERQPELFRARIADPEISYDPLEYRWMAQLVQMGPFCSGVMVSKWWLVTAAHCLVGRRAGSILVSGPFGVGRLKQTIIHPSYSALTLANNIALAEVSNDFLIQQWTVVPVVLPEPEQIFTSYATAAGYGTNSNRATKSLVAGEVQLPVKSLVRCRQIYSNNIVPDDVICAGMEYTGQAICRGDAGAALVQQLPPTVNQTENDPDRHILLGIGSFAFECGNGKYPSVFTKIPYHVNWIRQNVPELNEIINNFNNDK